MSDREDDPYGAHRFSVTSEALPTLGFAEVRGLSVAVAERDDEVKTEEREEATTARPSVSHWLDAPDHPKATIPEERRRTRSPPLELRRGLTDDRTLWTWLQDWVAREIEARDVRICLLDGGGRPVRGWICRAATPMRWIGPDLVAEREAVAFETLELVHEGIESIDDPEKCEARR